MALEFDWSGLGAMPLVRILWLAVIFLAAGVVYFGCLRLLGVRCMQILKKGEQ